MTTLCLVIPLALFDPPIDVKIWYEHGSKLASVNLKPSNIALPNIKGCVLESNNILWGDNIILKPPSFEKHFPDSTPPLHQVELLFNQWVGMLEALGV